MNPQLMFRWCWVIGLMPWAVPVGLAQESEATDSSSQEAKDEEAPEASPPQSPDQGPADDSSSAADVPNIKSRQPTVSEILRAFQESERPMLRPVGSSSGSSSAKANSAGDRYKNSARQHPRLPDGYYLVERAGWLGQEGDWYTFVFESEDAGDPQPPMKLLPNRMLEWMVRESEGTSEQAYFTVSGEVTDFFGENHLLLRKSLRKRNLGNLKK